MPTATITVADSPTGSEVATQSFTEDALTKHAQRFAGDLRLTGVTRSFLLTPTGSGVVGTIIAGTNIASIAHFAINPDAYITKIDIATYGSGASPKAAPIQMRRASLIVGGTTLVFAESAQETDTAATMPLLEFRSGSVTATEAATPMWTFGFFSPALPAIGGAYPARSWVAQDPSEWIRLTGTEGLLFDYPIASTTGNSYFISVTWREA